jgi:hypothetical protein
MRELRELLVLVPRQAEQQLEEQHLEEPKQEERLQE